METAKVIYGFSHMGINANAPEEAQALVLVLAMEDLQSKGGMLTFVASLFRGVDVNIGRIAYDFN